MVVVAADQNSLAVRAERNRPCGVVIVQFDLSFLGARLRVVDPHSFIPTIGKILAIGGEVYGSLCAVCMLPAAAFQLHDERVVGRIVQPDLVPRSDSQHLLVGRYSQKHDVLVSFVGHVRRILCCFLLLLGITSTHL